MHALAVNWKTHNMAAEALHMYTMGVMKSNTEN